MVVDANVISYLLIPGTLTDFARAAARKAEWSAPWLWRSEDFPKTAIHLRDFVQKKSG